MAPQGRDPACQCPSVCACICVGCVCVHCICKCGECECTVCVHGYAHVCKCAHTLRSPV
ncbi:unnamed protein product [Nyctereutes procyonoides]|uniref:(raccoon dog) hypothetical protein n=1 Tax=Nyctereutes procyonoides TaxID=34880 RepID=A0A811ZK42_NYCPR|nr:unnamed protein product [Nyctereutes procyonoides]